MAAHRRSLQTWADRSAKMRGWLASLARSVRSHLDARPRQGHPRHLRGRCARAGHDHDDLDAGVPKAGAQLGARGGHRGRRQARWRRRSMVIVQPSSSPRRAWAGAYHRLRARGGTVLARQTDAGCWIHFKRRRPSRRFQTMCWQRYPSRCQPQGASTAIRAAYE